MIEEIKATANLDVEGSDEKQSKSAQVQYDLGASISEAIEKYGESVVYALYKGAARVKIQGLLRSKIEQGEDEASIQLFFSTYKLGQELARVANPQVALSNQLSNMDDDNAISVIKALLAKRGISADALV